MYLELEYYKYPNSESGNRLYIIKDKYSKSILMSNFLSHSKDPFFDYLFISHESQNTLNSKHKVDKFLIPEIYLNKLIFSKKEYYSWK